MLNIEANNHTTGTYIGMLAGYSGEKVDKTIKKTRRGRLSQV